MKAIEYKGEKMWVESLEGHPGAVIIADNVPQPPAEPCSVCATTGVALLNAAQKETNRLNAMTNAELVAYLESRKLA